VRGGEAVDLQLEVASLADVDRVLDLRRSVAGWLAAEGIDLWQSPLDRGRLTAWIAQGAVLVHRAGDRIAGTVVVLACDPDTWGLDATPAVYVHLLMVDRSRAGENLGALILKHVEEMARTHGARYVRLDAGSDLQRLQRWYADRGYEVVTTRTLADGGATFDVTLRQKCLVSRGR
jgi:GNAT superfamily N-acetyltransferase